MGKRVDLHNLLLSICKNTYYQIPSNTVMSYPAIKYSRRSIDTIGANNNVYGANRSYIITVMDKSPDSPIVDKILQLPMCRHDRTFVSDGLNHDTFIIYY